MSKRNMYISFWLNRYQTNKYNAARKRKNVQMIYNILKTIPFIFHPFQQLNYSLGAREMRKNCTKPGTRNKSFQRNQKNWMFFFFVKIVKKYVNFSVREFFSQKIFIWFTMVWLNISSFYSRDKHWKEKGFFKKRFLSASRLEGECRENYDSATLCGQFSAFSG